MLIASLTFTPTHHTPITYYAQIHGSDKGGIFKAHLILIDSIAFILQNITIPVPKRAHTVTHTAHEEYVYQSGSTTGYSAKNTHRKNTHRKNRHTAPIHLKMVIISVSTLALHRIMHIMAMEILDLMYTNYSFCQAC